MQFALLADGALMARRGDTVVTVSAVSNRSEMDEGGFLPLSVEYREKVSFVCVCVYVCAFICTCVAHGCDCLRVAIRGKEQHDYEISCHSEGISRLRRSVARPCNLVTGNVALTHELVDGGNVNRYVAKGASMLFGS